MKKNTMMRIASVLLIAVVLSTCAISGTFAKFTTTATKTATASVATWNFTYANDSAEFAFNLFATDTIVDTVDGNADDEVYEGKIAPGTKGTCSVVLKNNSDVDAKFKITFAENLDGVPLELTYKNGDAVYTNGSYIDIGMNETKTITVSWVWEFGETEDDTEYAGKSPAVTASVVIEQVD